MEKKLRFMSRFWCWHYTNVNLSPNLNHPWTSRLRWVLRIDVWGSIWDGQETLVHRPLIPAPATIQRKMWGGIWSSKVVHHWTLFFIVSCIYRWNANIVPCGWERTNDTLCRHTGVDFPITPTLLPLSPGWHNFPQYKRRWNRIGSHFEWRGFHSAIHSYSFQGPYLKYPQDCQKKL